MQNIWPLPYKRGFEPRKKPLRRARFHLPSTHNRVSLSKKDKDDGLRAKFFAFLFNRELQKSRLVLRAAGFEHRWQQG
jgi:hypothetical protein